jgi:hypothetical protein
MNVGDEMVWKHQFRGDYGYVERIACRVVAIGRRRVVIEVKTKDGQTVQRLVKAENLEEKR